MSVHRRATAALALLTWATGGCQQESDGTPPGPASCGPDEVRADDGGCVVVGVPPERCAPGFTADGQGRCEPVLPAEGCPEGTLAVPGDPDCRLVAGCGSGTWGEIPLEPNCQHVDAAYAGGASDGTAERPFTTIQQAIDAAVAGGLVAVAAGSYDEGLSIRLGPVRIWGRCPELVELTGATAGGATVEVLDGGTGTELHTLAVRDGTVGIAVAGVERVLIDRIWLHDVVEVGLVVQAGVAPTSATVRGALFERAHAASILASGAELLLEGSVLRESLPGLGGGGHGVFATGDDFTGARSTVTIRSSVIEQSHGVGVAVLGSDATIEGSVIRHTFLAPSQSAGYAVTGRHDDQAGERARVTVRTSLVEWSHTIALGVDRADLTVEHSVVRDTEPDGADRLGRAIQVQAAPSTAAPASLELVSSVVERSFDVAVLLAGSFGHVAFTRVEDTYPRAHDGLHGDGVTVADPPSADTALSVVGSRIAASARVGLGSWGARVGLSRSEFECNRIDLNHETYGGQMGAIDDLGDNVCGCDDETSPCRVQTANLEPPTAP